MWWLLLLIPLVLIALVLFVRFRLCLVYEDELIIKIKVMFLKFSLYPKKQKKLNPRDYSLKSLQKKQDKLTKKKPKTKKQTDPSPKKDKATQIKDILDIIKIVLENVMSPFGRYLKVEIVRIYVKIATNDAAKTAVIYGLASQSVAYIIELLSNLTNVDVKRKNSIIVTSDFLSEKSEAKINITLGLKGWHAIALAVKFFMAYLKSKNKQSQNINSLKTQEE